MVYHGVSQYIYIILYYIILYYIIYMHIHNLHTYICICKKQIYIHMYVCKAHWYIDIYLYLHVYRILKNATRPYMIYSLPRYQGGWICMGGKLVGEAMGFSVLSKTCFLSVWCHCFPVAFGFWGNTGCLQQNIWYYCCFIVVLLYYSISQYHYCGITGHPWENQGGFHHFRKRGVPTKTVKTSGIL